MKNPHIRTLPSHRDMWRENPMFINYRLYGKRLKKAARLWLRGEGPMPEKLPTEIGRIEAFRFLMHPFVQ